MLKDFASTPAPTVKVSGPSPTTLLRVQPVAVDPEAGCGGQLHHFHVVVARHGGRGDQRAEEGLIGHRGLAQVEGIRALQPIDRRLQRAQHTLERGQRRELGGELRISAGQALVGRRAFGARPAG